MLFRIGDDLLLTSWRLEDRSALVELLQDRAIYEQTLRIPHPYTEADADSWFELVELTSNKAGAPVQWAIRDGDERLMGGFGFDGLVLGESYKSAIGYWLGRPFWGRGVMTRVVRAACEFAFAEFALEKLSATVFERNVASSRVLLKSGFREEGHLRRHYRKDGALLDGRLYGRLRDDPVE